MRLDIRYWIFASACSLLFSGCGKPVEPLPPEGFVAHATLSTNTLLVGDPVTLTLTARYPAGSTISFPNIGNGKEVAVRGRASSSRELTKTILESEELYQLTSFRVGDWSIATNPVVCTFSGGEQKIQALPELILHVQSSLNETNATKLSDIKDIVKPPLQIPRKLWILLIIALLALIAGLLTLLFLRKQRTDQPESIPPRPPHIIARQALTALRGKPWSPEPFFTELSLILRTYLEDRFSLNAPESTTEELTRSMASDTRLELKEQQTLRNFLTQA
ncbi:MAG: hypothetical protein WCG03_09370, partial [Kiritimatiellales bacterium]